MKCVGCSMDIPPAFVAAIKENKCPGCGNPCMEQDNYNALFHVVGQLRAASPDLAEDMCVRVASVLHGAFDIYPKGLVKDGYLTQEIHYVEVQTDRWDAPSPRRPIARADRSEAGFDDLGGDPGYIPAGSPKYARTRTHEGRQEHYARMRAEAQRSAQEEKPGEGAMRALEELRSRQPSYSGGEDFDGEVSARDLQDLEATRRAEERVRQLQAQGAGVHGRKRR